MKRSLLAALLITFPLARYAVADAGEITPAEVDVNSRYTIESAEISGQRSVALTSALRHELNAFVGCKLDHTALSRFADRIKRDLNVSNVSVKVRRGEEPDHVAVSFEVVQPEARRFDINVAKVLYHSQQGASVEGGATARYRGNAVSFSLLSDGDELAERFAGLRTKFERNRLGDGLVTGRLGFAFEFDSFHEQWNAATLLKATPAETYRTRQVFTPEATLMLAKPLELRVGVSFSRFQPASLDSSGRAANTESANAVVTTLRYHQRWGSEQQTQQQELAGEYSIRTATRILNTDSVYTRNSAKANYRWRRGRNTVGVGFLAGQISATAPLYERFVLGNSTTLRGWNKFDLDPVGGSHVVHGSVDYGYRLLQVFYDTGAVWDQPQDRAQKQSVGIGCKVEGIQLAVAFPLRGGSIEPVFYAGLNF